LILKKLTEIIFYNKSQLILYFNDGFTYLLNNETEQRERLIYTFKIFSKNETTVSILLNLFKEFSKTKFNELLTIYQLNTPLKKNIPPKDIATKTDFLQKYLIFQEKMSKIISCFEGNSLFNVIFKEVLEDIQSDQDNINTSYLLPFYFDQYLRKSYKISLNYDTSIEGINQGLLIFPYISEKDVFIDIHKHLLSNRLINNDIISIDCETYLINKLKTQCGVEYTIKIEGMINDYLSNIEMNNQFKDRKNQICNEEKNNLNEKDNDYNLDDNSKLILKNIDSSFYVLSYENWPSNINIRKVLMPKELDILTNTMYNFYKEKFKGRILKWSFANSLMEIEYSLINKKYTLICNTFQGVILLYFNNPSIRFDNSINENDLIKGIQFENINDFNKSIEPFLKIKLILKNENNSYLLNKNFTFNDNEIKIINQLYDEEYIKKEKIQDERNETIDGTIIRILKAKKKIGHNDLINTVLSQLDRFKIKIASIKARIDSLITRDFIYRDKDDPNCYIYATTEN